MSLINLNADTEKVRPIFKELERIELKLEKVHFATLSTVVPVPDGFILLVKESAFGNQYALIKISKSGAFVSVYNKRGNGPGELRTITNMVATKNSILVGELSAPYVHEFSHDLIFKEDHRIKSGGKLFQLGQYLGIWTVNYKKVGNNNKTYILALYDRKTFEFKRFAYEIGEIPAFVQYWGGICQIDDNYFAGIYPTHYQIKVFNKELQFEKNLIKMVPKHIKKYHPWKKSPSHMDNSALKWMHSWSKPHSIFFIEGKFILKHLVDNQQFLDVISKDGEILRAVKEGKNRSCLFSEGPSLWKLHWDDDNDEKIKFYTLVKYKLVL